MPPSVLPSSEQMNPSRQSLLCLRRGAFPAEPAPSWAPGPLTGLLVSLQEKQKLLDEIEDLTVQLTEEQEKKRKMGDKLSQERHQFQKEKESTQEVSGAWACHSLVPKMWECGFGSLSRNGCLEQGVLPGQWEGLQELSCSTSAPCAALGFVQPCPCRGCATLAPSLPAWSSAEAQGASSRSRGVGAEGLGWVTPSRAPIICAC